MFSETFELIYLRVFGLFSWYLIFSKVSPRPCFMMGALYAVSAGLSGCNIFMLSLSPLFWAGDISAVSRGLTRTSHKHNSAWQAGPPRAALGTMLIPAQISSVSAVQQPATKSSKMSSHENILTFKIRSKIMTWHVKSSRTVVWSLADI